MSTICKCFVCSPKPAPSKTRRLSPAALAVALKGQQPKGSKSVIMPPSRFRKFMGKQSVSAAMQATTVPLVQTLAPGTVGTGRVAPAPMAL